MASDGTVFMLSEGPWFPANKISAESTMGRAYLWVRVELEQITCSPFGELKFIGQKETLDGRNWRCFELPKKCDDSVTHLDIRASSARENHRIQVPIVDRLPSRRILENVERLMSEGADDLAVEHLLENGFSESALQGLQIARLIDRHSDLMYQLSKRVRRGGRFEDYDLDGIRARSVRRVANQWGRIGSAQEPPLSLIVRLSEEIPKVLEEVCSIPRVVLRRQREVEHATRIQQVDSACIRWIGKQPGRSLGQKAGPHQRLMGVVRREDVDTQENRIVRDLVKRCIYSGTVYIARNRSFASHPRFKVVRAFVMLCEKLLRESKIRQVSPLVGVPQTNYVLLHETRYSVLWEAYQRLIRQEKVTQETWTWRNRIWNEWLSLAICQGLSRICITSPAMRQTISVSDEPSTGEYCRLPSLGPWWIRTHDGINSFHLLSREQSQSCPFLPEWLVELSPDFVLCSFEKKVCGAAIWSDLDVLDTEGSAIRCAAQLQGISADFDLSRWKLFLVSGGSDALKEKELSQSIAAIAVPLMLQDFQSEWQQFLQKAVTHAS